jgi:peroxiredoxin Q/BCP
MTKLQVGDSAPEFALPAADGQTVRLQDYRGRRHVVLYFYVKDDTPGCTREARGFTEVYPELQELDAEVLGVSVDDPASHQAFSTKCGVPYPLLSDTTKEVTKAYGALGWLGLLPKRVTFVIDKAGTIRHIFESMSPGRHIDEARQAIRELSARADA